MFTFGLLLLLAVNSRTERPRVTTSNGIVEGISDITYADRPYQGFYGIPFAEPPLGDLRFAKPVRAHAWDGVWDASQNSSECVQGLTNLGTGEEDCLYLNVIVPGKTINTRSSKPVLVHTHGGGFMSGSANIFHGEDFSTFGDFIFVNFNYRLAAFGFLVTDDESSPGNVGLWDSLMVLQWIQENIRNFGGDPTKVTLMGQSAGAMSINHLISSPLTNGLYRSVISLSGSSSSFAGYTTREDSEAAAKGLADLCLCPSDDTKEMLACLRQVPAQELSTLSISAHLSTLRFMPWTPFVDDELLVLPPRDAWQRYGVTKNINYISSHAKHDAAYFTLNMGFKNYTINLAAEPLLVSLTVNMVCNLFDDIDKCLDLVEVEYPGIYDDEVRTRTEAVVAMGTDWIFAADSMWQADQHSKLGAKSSRTYYTILDYHPSFMIYPDWVSAIHSDDHFFIFGPDHMRVERESYNRTYSDYDNTVTRALMSYFSNFAHTGDPNVGPHRPPVEWREYDEKTREYLHYNPNIEVVAADESLKKMLNFWNKIFADSVKPREGDDEKLSSDALRKSLERIWEENYNRLIARI